MKYWKIVCPWLPAAAMALYPFMLFKRADLKNSAVINNHEKIHFMQQLELLIIPFYLIYLLHYLINLTRYRNHDRAYTEICFEQEAYRHDQESDYLKKRKPYSWARNR